MRLHMLAVLFCARQEGALVWAGTFRKLILVHLLFPSAEIERAGVPSPSFWFCNSYLFMWSSWEILLPSKHARFIGPYAFSNARALCSCRYQDPKYFCWVLKHEGEKVSSEVANTWAHRLLAQAKQFLPIPFYSLAFWNIILLMHTQACSVTVSPQPALSFSETKWCSNSRQVRWWGHHGQHSICVLPTLPLLLMGETM